MVPPFLLLFFTVIPLAVDGGADAHQRCAFADGVLVIAAHAHGEGLHLHVGIAALPGLYEQVMDGGEIPAVLCIVIIDRRNGI